MKKEVLSRENFLFAICFFILMASCFRFSINTGITASGVLVISYAEIIGIATAIFLGIYIFIRRPKINKDNFICIILTVCFAVFCFPVYLFRTVFHGFELTSMVIFQATLAVIPLMFLILFNIIPVRIIIKALTVFSVVLGCVSVILFYNTLNPIAYTVLSHHMGRTYVLTALLPISAYQYLLSSKKHWGICYYIHLGTVVFCNVASGTRIGVYIVPVIIVMVFLIQIKKNKFSIKYSILAILVSISLCFITAPFYVQMYVNLSRIPVARSVMDVVGIEYSPTVISLEHLDEETIEILRNEIARGVIDFDRGVTAAEIEYYFAHRRLYVARNIDVNQANTDMRLDVWREALSDISANPLFGIGLRQYNFQAPGFPPRYMTTHNFMLDYALAFGIIGLLLFMIMTSIPLILASISKKRTVFKHTAFLLMIPSFLSVMAGAMLHTYFLNPSIMAILYLLIGTYTMLIRCEDITPNASMVFSTNSDIGFKKNDYTGDDV